MDRPRCAAGRSEVIAAHGMVATSQPLAVMAGVDVLRRGGTAVDAAIAANAMLGLVEPMSCGLGGDLFAIVWDAKAERLHGLNGSGRAPRAMTRASFADRGLDRIPDRGPLTWTVPGCVDGWFALHERFGRLPMSELLAPTIAAADEGFPVSPVIGRAWSRATELLASDPGARETFLIDGRAPRVGERMRNPALAASLRAIATRDRGGFYRGPIAEAIAASAGAHGGFLELDDLASHDSTWVEPISTTYRGFDVWELPPNTQGLAVLQMLSLLEGFDLRALGHNSTELLHLWIEAKKLAYEDRARHYADPAFAEVPLDRLLSKEHAVAQRARIDPARAADAFPPLDGPPGDGDTVYLTAVDEERNAVSFIQSIYQGFGSGIAPGGVGFAMQNRGSLFALDPTHANALEPGKRPFHTIIPGFVTKHERPLFSFGVMGGDMQPQGQVQVLLNRLVFGMDVEEAGAAARIRHDGSSTPVGDVMSDGGTVHVEPGISDDVVDGLRARGHRVEVSTDGYGGYQGIWIDEAHGVLRGGSERRKDGCAIGY